MENTQEGLLIPSPFQPFGAGSAVIVGVVPARLLHVVLYTASHAGIAFRPPPFPPRICKSKQLLSASSDATSISSLYTSCAIQFDARQLIQCFLNWPNPTLTPPTRSTGPPPAGKEQTSIKTRRHHNSNNKCSSTSNNKNNGCQIANWIRALSLSSLPFVLPQCSSSLAPLLSLGGVKTGHWRVGDGAQGVAAAGLISDFGN